MKKNVAFTLISFGLLKWDEYLSFQLPFELPFEITFQLLLECTNENVDETNPYFQLFDLKPNNLTTKISFSEDEAPKMKPFCYIDFSYNATHMDEFKMDLFKYYR